MSVELMEAIAIGQRENHKKNIDKLKRERTELLCRLVLIDQRISKEVDNFQRMDYFLKGK